MNVTDRPCQNLALMQMRKRIIMALLDDSFSNLPVAMRLIECATDLIRPFLDVSDYELTWSLVATVTR